MKTEDIIKKASERGIILNETAAEKYIALSDEELTNLAVAGGKDCNDAYYVIEDLEEEAKKCLYFEPSNKNLTTRKCNRCKYVAINPSDYSKAYCKNPDKNAPQIS
ncbi:MAG: hypothetical protein LBM59_06215 [Ruminococcus sp.]|jgi:hypothetical protein|nr:hypothetical protein [Ruminococcus sp.]